MSILLDVAFLAIFALVVFFAAKKGFFATLMALAAYVASLIGAKLLSTALAPQIYENYFADQLRETVATQLTDVGVTDYAAQIESTIRSIPEFVGGIMETLGISKEQILTQLQNSPLQGKRMIDNIMTNFVSPVTTAVIRTVLFVVIALLLSVLLRIVASLLNKLIKKLPAIKQINTSLGVVLGVIRGAIVVVLVALCLDVVAGFVGNPTLTDMVRHSYVETAISGFFNSISGYVTA